MSELHLKTSSHGGSGRSGPGAVQWTPPKDIGIRARRLGERVWKRRLRQIAWTGAALLFGSSLAFGDEPRPLETFEDSATTVVVEVPVEVTLDGEPVRGLGPESFELIDDGDPQDILSVDVVDLGTLGVDGRDGRGAVDALPVVARRHFLLLFDVSFSEPASIERARLAALDLVRRDLHPADLVSVAVYSLNRGARILLAFTPDRDQVALALANLGQTESVKTRSDPLKLFLGEPDRSIDADLETSRGYSADRRGVADGTFRQLQAMADRARAAQGRREVDAMARSLGELGSLLRSVDGRKHVVFFSEGFDGDLLLGTTDQDRRAELNRRAQTGSIEDFATLDSAEYFGSASTLNVLEEMNQEFRRSDCTVHAVDVSGLRQGGASAGRASAGRASAGRAKDGLFMIADGTGGDFYENFNDLGEAMGRMLEKTSVTYVLSYQPRSLRANGEYRKLKVKVNGLPRKAKVVHRPGYFAPDADAPAGHGAAAQLSLAQKLWDGREGGSVGARVLATPLRTEGTDWGKKTYVGLLLEIDGPSLLREPAAAEPNKKRAKKKAKEKRRKGRRSGTPAAGPARAEVFVYALDAEGRVSDFFSQSIALDPRAAGPALTERGLKLYAPLLLPEGPHGLRILVRNSHTGAVGLRLARVEVPPADETSPRLLAPLFPETVDSWLLVRGRRGDVSSEAEPDYPFFHGSTVYAPAVEPQVEPGQVVPVFLAGYGIEGVRGLQSEVIDSWGRVVAEPRWRLDDRLQRGEDGLERYAAAFEVPQTLDPGVYSLRVSLSNEASVESRPGSLDFEVIPAGAETRRRLLTLDSPPDFGPPPDPGAVVESPAVVSASMDRSDLRDAEPAVHDGLDGAEILESYRSALGRWASSGTESLRETLAEVAAIEVAAVGADGERRALSRLARKQLKVARELADRDPEALVPLLLLHHDLFQQHREMRRPLLALHSRELVQELAELYARLGGTEGSRVTAARALAGIGGRLAESGRGAGLDLLELSLVFDPTHESALLGLAVFHEKHGGPYGESVRYLERLVEARPESREGRLRLAVNQLRLAEETGTMSPKALEHSAVEHFERLLQGPEADWIYSLAAQELARRHAAEGSLDEAVAVLEAALERRGGDQKLHLQLALLLDRTRRGREAGRRALRAVEASVDSETVVDPAGDPAARGRYNRWPNEALDADRRLLREGASARLPSLGSVTEEAGSGS